MVVATSEDVARQAGVSRATVSQILNGRADRFAADTRHRVLQAAADLGYQPSVAGRTLARGSSDFVIALVPNTTFGGNLQDIFESMTDQLAAHGLTLMLRMATRSAESMGRIVAGVLPAAVMSLAPFSDAERALLKERAVVAVDPVAVGGSHDNEDIGHVQARYLIEHGHTRLAFAHLYDTRGDPFGPSRAAGVVTACHEAGLAGPQIVQLGIDPTEALAALDSLQPPGVAIACYNDDVAIALLGAATTRGWRVPQDVALIGMDAIPLSRVTLPPLTTVSYNLSSAVDFMTHTLLASLGRQTVPPASTGSSIHLIEGRTV